MSIADILYSTDFPGPEILEKSRDNLVKCPIYRDGALVAPDSAAITLYDQNRVVLIDAETMMITNDIAQYTIEAAILASGQFSEGWTIEYELVFDGVYQTFQNDCALVRRRLYPVVTDIVIQRRNTDIRELMNSNQMSLQNYIDEAWYFIESKLIAMGRRPWLVMSPSSLREVHIAKTLHLIAIDFSTSQGESSKWNQLTEVYEKAFKVAWEEVSFVYEENSDGKPGLGRKAGTPAFWLMQSPRIRRAIEWG